MMGDKLSGATDSSHSHTGSHAGSHTGSNTGDKSMLDKAKDAVGMGDKH
jgi:hypothetical protein